MFNGIKWSDCIPLRRLAAIIATLLLKAGVTVGGGGEGSAGPKVTEGELLDANCQLEDVRAGSRAL